MLALIIFNCVLLAMDNPSVTDGSTLRAVLDNTDLVFAAFFAFEMVAKLIAWGGVTCGSGYVQSSTGRFMAFLVLQGLTMCTNGSVLWSGLTR